MKKPSLIKSFSWTFVGNTIYFSSQYAVLIVLAKLASSTDMGNYAFGLAISTPVFLFTNMALRPIMVTDQKKIFMFREYLVLRLSNSIIGFVFIALLSITIKGSSDTRIILIIVALSKLIEAIADIFYAYYQLNERLDIVSKSQIVKGISSLVGLALVLHATGNVFLGLLAFSGVRLSVFLFFDLYSYSLIANGAISSKHRIRIFLKEIKITWAVLRKKQIKGLVKISLPLAFAMIFSSLSVNIPYYFFKYYFDESVLGIFAALSSFMRVNGLIVNSLGQASTVRLSQYYHVKARKLFSALIIKLSAFGLFIGVIGVLVSVFLGKFILTLLFQANYAQYSMVLIFLMVAAMMENVAVFLGFAMTAGRMLKIQPFIFVGAVIVSVVSCILFLQQYRLMGGVFVFGVISTFRIIISFASIVYLFKHSFH